MVWRPVRPRRSTARRPDLRSTEACPRADNWEEPAIEGVPYGADMRLFIRLGDLPCVMYGAGDVNVAHAPDEHLSLTELHLSLTELMSATKTVACLLADWCG
jgi:acetylornithine deacetylase